MRRRLRRNLLWRVVKQPARCQPSRRHAGLRSGNSGTRAMVGPSMVSVRHQVSTERIRLRQSGVAQAPRVGRLRGVPGRLLEPNRVPGAGLLLESLQRRLWETGLRSQRTTGSRQTQADPQTTAENGRKTGQLRFATSESKVRAADKEVTGSPDIWKQRDYLKTSRPPNGEAAAASRISAAS